LSAADAGDANGGRWVVARTVYDVHFSIAAFTRWNSSVPGCRPGGRKRIGESHPCRQHGSIAGHAERSRAGLEKVLLQAPGIARTASSWRRVQCDSITLDVQSKTPNFAKAVRVTKSAEVRQQCGDGSRGAREQVSGGAPRESSRYSRTTRDGHSIG